jgi:hypothetical protein
VLRSIIITNAGEAAMRSHLRGVLAVVAAMSVVVAALSPKPANWTSDKIKKETDGELFWKVSNGRGPMPPWKHLPEKERWQIVNYIRELQKKK